MEKESLRISMKIAVLSDIHGNAAALRAVLADIRKENILDCAFLGDLIAKGPQPLEVLELLDEIHPICWVLGNTDLWAKGNYSGNSRRARMIRTYQNYLTGYLSADEIDHALRHPQSASFQTGGAAIRCVHGSARDIEEAVASDAPEAELQKMFAGTRETVVLCGHSHIPFIRRTERGILFNPGSVGSPYDGNPEASYGIMLKTNSSLEFSLRRVGYPIDETLKIARRRNYPDYVAYSALLRSGRKVSQ